MAEERSVIVGLGWLCLIAVVSCAPTPNSTVDADKSNYTATPRPMTSPKPAPNSTFTTVNETVKEDPIVDAATLKKCTLATHQHIPLHIRELLDGGVSLIKYHISINDEEQVFRGKYNSLMYRPLFWVRSTGRQGIGLLHLKPNYDKLSLSTLEMSVETMEVNVIQHPPLCLRQLGDLDIERLFRRLVMNDFQNTSAELVVALRPSDNVCNIHLTNNSGTAEFRYMCCQRNEFNEVHCKYLEKDLWVKVLFAFITLIKVLVVLFSPRLVPEVYYRAKHVAAMYTHKLQPNNKLIINTVTTMEPSRYMNATVKVKLSALVLMDKFKKFIAMSRLDEPRQITLDKLSLRVKHDRLLPEDYAPVDLITTLYKAFFKCELRKRSSIQDCCNADFLGKCNCRKTFTWYRVLRTIMNIVMLVLLATPWFLRIGAYYKWEDPEIRLQKEAARARLLNFYFPGNLTVLLTPLHALFLFIYAFLSIESCVFGVLGRKVQERLKMVLRKCFRDMREMSKLEVVGWAIKVLFKPCTNFGGFGLIIGAVFWVPVLPIMSVIVAFYLLPTLNITFRLFAHFAIHLFPTNFCGSSGCLKQIGDWFRGLEIKLEMETLSRKESLEKRMLYTYRTRIQQLIVIIMCLISMYSIIFLITEFVSFIVEVLVYTLMGVILHAAAIYKYISLLFLLGIYANDCFGHVSGKYLVFNRKMNEIMLKLVKEKVSKIIYDNEDNFAFRVKTEHMKEDPPKENEEPYKLTKNSEGFLRWNVKHLCLFLSKNDKPLIPSRFYFTACHMPFYLAPGELMLNYLKAALDFAAILIFLLFVLIVVMAFGDSYEISATNELLATLAGGLLPLLLRKAIFKSHDVPTIDDSSIHFQTCLNDLVAPYSEDWPIFDFDGKDEDGDSIDAEPSAQPSDQASPDDIVVTYHNGTNGTHGVSESGKGIDLVIDVRDIDSDEFPEMAMSLATVGDPTSVGSTSLLEDEMFATEKEMELRNIVKD